MIYILGGGLSGLLAGFVTKGIVISEDIGGRFTTIGGPKIIEHSTRVENLFKSIGIKEVPTYFKVGYINSLMGKPPIILDQPDEGFREAYIYKTRGHSGNYLGSPNSYMSGSKAKIYGWDYNKFKKGLHEMLEVKQIYGKVISVKRDEIVFRHKGVSLKINLDPKRDMIISTIPLPSLMDMIKLGYHDLSTLPIYNDLCAYGTVFFKGSPGMFNTPTQLSDEKAYYYVVGPTPIHRITMLGGKLVGYEARADVIDYSLMKKSLDYTISNNCQIKWDANVDQIGDNIMLLGRYAQWNHSMKFNTVLDRLMDKKDMWEAYL